MATPDQFAALLSRYRKLHPADATKSADTVDRDTGEEKGDVFVASNNEKAYIPSEPEAESWEDFEPEGETDTKPANNVPENPGVLKRLLRNEDVPWPEVVGPRAAAYGNGVGESLMPFGDELVGVTGAGHDKLKEMYRRATAFGDHVPEQPSFQESRLKHQQESRDASAKEAAEFPTEKMAGKATGYGLQGLATAAVPGGIPAKMALGAFLGGMGGAGESEEETLDGRLSDAAVPAAVGGAAGLGMGVAKPVAKAAIGGLSAAALYKLLNKLF